MDNIEVFCKICKKDIGVVIKSGIFIKEPLCFIKNHEYCFIENDQLVFDFYVN